MSIFLPSVPYPDTSPFSFLLARRVSLSFSFSSLLLLCVSPFGKKIPQRLLSIMSPAFLALGPSRTELTDGGDDPAACTIGLPPTQKRLRLGLGRAAAAAGGSTDGRFGGSEMSSRRACAGGQWSHGSRTRRRRPRRRIPRRVTWNVEAPYETGFVFSSVDGVSTLHRT